MGYYKDLIVFKKAYQLAMDIFTISKKFPKEENFSLVSQIRKSSRSVCANLAEAYKRRKYKPYFLAKLTDSDTENTETEIWIDFSKDCNYIETETYERWFNLNKEVSNLIHHMINNPDKFL